jgi:hypothetical protein
MFFYQCRTEQRRSELKKERKRPKINNGVIMKGKGISWITGFDSA